MRRYSCSEGHGFESQHWTFFTFFVMFVVFVWQDENKRKRGQEGPFCKKGSKTQITSAQRYKKSVREENMLKMRSRFSFKVLGLHRPKCQRRLKRRQTTIISPKIGFRDESINQDATRRKRVTLTRPWTTQPWQSKIAKKCLINGFVFGE